MSVFGQFFVLLNYEEIICYFFKLLKVYRFSKMLILYELLINY